MNDVRAKTKFDKTYTKGRKKEKKTHLVNNANHNQLKN